MSAQFQNSFWYRLKDRLRRFKNTLPKELRFERECESEFLRDSMLRDAGLAIDLNMKTGIFKLLGLEAAARAIRAKRPQEFFLMEDLSVVFHAIELRVRRRIIPAEIHLQRFIELLDRLRRLQRLSIPRAETEREIRTALAKVLPEDASPESEGSEKIVVDHPLLDELTAIDEELDLHFPGESSPTTLGEVGLYLSKEFDGGRYDWCTPLNCVVFARTGGDGTHYSLLRLDGAIRDESPVVMTMPSYGGMNFIVGDSLRDFLNLGSTFGWFSIEQIGYDEQDLKFFLDGNPGADASDLEEIRSGMWPLKTNILRFLNERLELRPWTDLEHWSRLQAAFAAQLVLPPNF
ncbi:MAG: hypothetical protein QM811_25255 [Pirellulales bacterium]